MWIATAKSGYFYFAVTGDNKISGSIPGGRARRMVLSVKDEMALSAMYRYVRVETLLKDFN